MKFHLWGVYTIQHSSS